MRWGEECLHLAVGKVQKVRVFPLVKMKFPKVNAEGIALTISQRFTYDVCHKCVYAERFRK